MGKHTVKRFEKHSCVFLSRKKIEEVVGNPEEYARFIDHMVDKCLLKIGGVLSDYETSELTLWVDERVACLLMSTDDINKNDYDVFKRDELSSRDELGVKYELGVSDELSSKLGIKPNRCGNGDVYFLISKMVEEEVDIENYN